MLINNHNKFYQHPQPTLKIGSKEKFPEKVNVKEKIAPTTKETKCPKSNEREPFSEKNTSAHIKPCVTMCTNPRTHRNKHPRNIF